MQIDSKLNLILTGFMGTGKTTIGQMVAQRLNRRFVDMDQVITQRSGRTVPEIFKHYGETTFREWEAAFCREFSEPDGLVISTGGGALTFEENRRVMTAPGNVIVCLTGSPESILQRLQGDQNRPLFGGDTQRVMDLYKKRLPLYRKFRLQLDTSDLDTESAATAVIHLFDRELERNSIRTVVHTPEGEYDILCMSGLLQKIPYILENFDLNNRVMVVTNTTLAPLYGQQIVEMLPNAALITMQDGEAYKNMTTVEQLYSDFVKAGMDRSGIVMAVGGGVVGDTAGFVASTYMRGVKFIQIPTSLLAMVDSSVGGKVGVDIPEGKNLVGAFKQPEIVLIDPAVLKTLPQVEIQCGLAEAIKHGLLADPDLLNCVNEIATGNDDLIRRTIQVKVDVVQRDPFEEGERAHLNLGHTFGHAVEQVSGYRWRHGEAVGFGLVAAARLSHEISTLSADQVARIEAIVAGAGLPIRMNEFDPESIWKAMHTDKKWRGGRNLFVILEDIGKPKIVRDVPKEVVIKVLENLRE